MTKHGLCADGPDDGAVSFEEHGLEAKLGQARGPWPCPELHHKIVDAALDGARAMAAYQDGFLSSVGFAAAAAVHEHLWTFSRGESSQGLLHSAVVLLARCTNFELRSLTEAWVPTCSHTMHLAPVISNLKADGLALHVYMQAQGTPH